MRQGWREVASDGAVRRYESRVETAAVLALCALAIGGNVAGVEGLWRTVLAVALGAAMTLPLLARRRAPLAVLTAVVGAAWVQFALLGPSVGALGSWMAYLVATFAVGAHHATRWAVVTSQPVGLSGTPPGQVSSARSTASCAQSSARSRSLVSRAVAATTTGHAPRKTSSIHAIRRRAAP